MKSAALVTRWAKGFDMQVIHDYRVAVKTLRAYLRFLKFYGGTSGLKMSKEFKGLYHAAGGMRDAQVELDALNEKTLYFPAYQGNIHRLLQNQQQRWQRLYSKKTAQALAIKLNRSGFVEVPPLAVDSFINVKLAEIHKLAAIKSPTDNDVHSIRKAIKDIVNLAKLFKKEWKAAYKIIPQSLIAQLDSLADEAGKYNDERLLLEHLRTFSSKAMTGEERMTIKKYCTQEARRIAPLKTAILRKVKGIGR